MRVAESVLLRYASDRERLTGKPGDKHVVIRDQSSDLFVGLRNLANVSNDFVIRPEVRPIGFHAVFVVFRGEHAAPTRAFEPEAGTADAGEQINERKVCRGHRLYPRRLIPKEIRNG